LHGDVPTLVLSLSGCALGLAFAWSAGAELRQQASALQTQAAWLVLLHALLVFGPCVGYLLSFHSDWAFSYWIRANALPRGALTTVIAAVSCMPFVGFLAGASLARQRKTLPLLVVTASLGLACVLGCLLTLPRLLVSATYVQYHDDFGTRGIAGSPLGHALLGMTAIVVAASLWCVNTLRSARPASITRHD
jgi:cytochrome bd-type quinol oxidase subunit 2